MSWTPIAAVVDTPINSGLGDPASTAFNKCNQAIAQVNALKTQYIDPRDYAGYDNTGATDQTALFQACVNAAITQKIPVRVPTGLFLINGTINCANTLFDQVAILGNGGFPRGNSSFLNFTANTIFVSGNTTVPTFSINSARGTHLADFAIFGQNTAPYQNSPFTGGGVGYPNDTQTNYISSGCRQAQNSPYCGIAVDAFNSAVPTDAAGGINTGGINGYPGGTYAGSTIDGSSNLLIENIHITGFVVGVAHGISGVGSQSDQTLYHNVYVEQCDSGFVIGHGQAKIVTFQQCVSFYCRNGVDNVSYGAVNQGCPPRLDRHHFEFVYRAFAMPSAWGNCLLDGCYGESIATLGNMGTGFTSLRSSLIFNGGNFDMSGTGDWTGYVQPPLLLETQVPTQFNGTSFTSTGTSNFISSLNVAAFGPLVEFNACSLVGTASASVPPFIGVTLNSTNGCRIADSWIDSSGGAFIYSDNTGRTKALAAPGSRLIAMHQMSQVSVGKTDYSYSPPYGDSLFTIGGCSAFSISGTTLTYTTTANAQVLVGDVQCWLMLAQGTSTVQATVPAWKVTNVSGTTITATALYNIAQYDTTANYVANVSASSMFTCVAEWAPTVSLTATTSTDATLSSVSPTTILKNNDWVMGTGLPTGTRVVSGGGTASIVLNQATTASNSGVNLFLGRLFSATVTAAF